VLARLLTKLAPTRSIELEGDDGPIGQRVELGLRIHQVAAGDDAAVVECVQEADRLHPNAGGRGAPAEDDTPGKLTGDGRDAQQTVHPGVCGLRDEVFSGDPTPSGRLDQSSQHSTRQGRGISRGSAVGRASTGGVLGPRAGGLLATGSGRVLGPRPDGVSAQQLLDRGWLGRLGLAFDSQIAEGPVHRRKDLLQRCRLVGDLELEKRAPLHDSLSPGGVGNAGELHHDAVVSDLLDHGLLDPELINSLAQHGQGQVQILLRVGGDLLGLVELEGQVHSALKIESALERHSGHHHIVHDPVGTGLTDRDVPGEKEIHRRYDEHGDEKQPGTNG
jgi:hypothetical protein